MPNIKATTRRRYDLRYSDEISKDSQNEPIMPTVEFYSNEIPGLEDWEVGKEYTLRIVARLDTLTKNKDGVSCGYFKVLGVKEDMDMYTDEQKKFKNLMS